MLIFVPVSVRVPLNRYTPFFYQICAQSFFLNIPVVPNFSPQFDLLIDYFTRQCLSMVDEEIKNIPKGCRNLREEDSEMRGGVRFYNPPIHFRDGERSAGKDD